MAANESQSGSRTVFNLEVEGTHEYFAGAGEIRSHNGCVKGAPKVTPPGKVKAPDGGPKGGVYTLEDASGRVVKTGRSKDLNRREGEHGRNHPDLKFKKKHRTDDYNQQRGLEEKLFSDHHDTAWRENGGLDKIKPIADLNGRGTQYRNAANSFLNGD